ncbi:DNA-binding protein [Candidatus Formimonas warabiya]|uniref:ArsR family transcriptional regulator n=1 Tax=Formimonas warabiya TaxID=1761012 RepID=A0A3G1KQT5_FORW1|nr:DNA-binding protein [Candidatus Formimonas warabiya]ATW24806.1 hypothetical protein DCMF_08490 [Candidatus Formimonas warabiya]
MADLLPLKSRILSYISGVEGEVSLHDIRRDLQQEYQNERQFNQRMISQHLSSLCAVGMIEVGRVAFGPKGELVINYQITGTGVDRLKYLDPAGGQKNDRSLK